jgi:hypothetical protein
LGGDGRVESVKREVAEKKDSTNVTDASLCAVLVMVCEAFSGFDDLAKPKTGKGKNKIKKTRQTLQADSSPKDPMQRRIGKNVVKFV